jgi:hypothetical protein
MQTGIYIRVNQGRIQGWENLDIGDPELTDDNLMKFLMTRDNLWLARCVMILLGRNP